MRYLNVVVGCLIASVGFQSTTFARELPPQDHGGASLTLTDGDVIWGEHTGIGSFLVGADSTVRVKPFDGEPGGSLGSLVIRARDIEVLGTIDATGAGYTGGSGGGGGGYGFGTPSSNGGFSSGRPAGGVRYGGSEHRGETGQPGRLVGGRYVNGRGGRGGRGDGPGSGSNGQYIAPPGAMQLLVWMGSGADGENGTEGISTETLRTGLNGSGGAAGGSGGGAISLYATDSLTIGPAAAIVANGTPGRGVLTFPPRSPHSEGWTVDDQDAPVLPTRLGAGGGILLHCLNAQPQIQSGATIETLGGGTQVGNGGTIILHMPNPPYTTGFPGAVFNAGSLQVSAPPGTEVTGFTVR